MGLALYRKYRPKGLDDVVGQDHIVTSLKNALKSGKISHAYLFTGPRGVGKTSVARILAHEINGLPYTDDRIHLDIIEIDAASNRRIDEIRDLRDKVHIAPTSAKYKVYIIDEVHMLTREAFNALLKTLEEPPAHVVFILATTEAHKVPDTIASRTQRFTFKPINRSDTVGHLRDLAKQEKIKIDDEALEALADHASGSFRDSINLLDQMVGDGETISRLEVETMLGLPNPQVVVTLYDALQIGDLSLIANTVAEARIAGSNAGSLAKALGEKIRSSIIEAGTSPDTKTVGLLRQLVSATNERDAFLGLELALFDYASVPSRRIEAAVVAKSPKTIVAEEADEPIPAPAPEEPEEVDEPIIPEAAATDEEYWTELLGAIKKNHNTLYGVLRMAQPKLDGDVLTLAFNFAFHQKQMSQAANQKRLADAVSSLLGRSIEVHSIHQKDTVAASVQPKAARITQKQPTATRAADSSLTDVKSVFSGAELLE